MTDASMNRSRLAGEFDEAIDRLEEALRLCPDDLWQASMWPVRRTDPWIWPRPGTEPIVERTDESIQIYSSVAGIVYHCLWFLDFYVTTDAKTFQSPEYVRGGAQEMDWAADGAAPLPGWVFPKEVLLRYLEHGRRRVRERLASVSETEMAGTCPDGHPHAGKTLSQLVQVNLDHVREHSGQIRAFLIQNGVRLN